MSGFSPLFRNWLQTAKTCERGRPRHRPSRISKKEHEDVPQLTSITW